MYVNLDCAPYIKRQEQKLVVLYYRMEWVVYFIFVFI